MNEDERHTSDEFVNDFRINFDLFTTSTLRYAPTETPLSISLHVNLFITGRMSTVTKQPIQVGISIVFRGRSRDPPTKTFWFPSKFLQAKISAD